MAALIPSGGPSTGVDPATWAPVDDAAAVPAARRQVIALAQSLGWSAEQVGEAAIVASELATNLIKHAGGGDLVLRSTGSGTIQLLAVDSGPGTRDLAGLVRDGVSTSGTLGVGLGAVGRLAARLDLWSEPSRGAVVVAELGPDDAAPRLPVGHLLRPLRGEVACGDAVSWRPTRTGWLAALADGLGHGRLAADASERAMQVIGTSSSESPQELVGLAHRAIGGTRGVAIAVTLVDLVAGTLTHAAVGNIVGRLIDPTARTRSLATQPGIVGHRLPRVREVVLPLEHGELLVLHSDGLTERWSGADVPSVATHGPEVCAAVLLRDAGTRRDDAGVLTLQVSLR